jgi:spermidine synthase
MKPFILLDSCRTPDNSLLELYQHDKDFFFHVNNKELMGSRAHKSEDFLGMQPCRNFDKTDRPTILIGGLGMGYTLRAVLDVVPKGSKVIVAELLDKVIEWNREHIGDLTDHPLKDRRVSVQQIDVKKLIKGRKEEYDVIILDVDNGPAAFTDGDNQTLYSNHMLGTMQSALKIGGRLAIWSTTPDRIFEARLKRLGFAVKTHEICIHGDTGARSVIWIARRQREHLRIQHTSKHNKWRKF